MADHHPVKPQLSDKILKIDARILRGKSQGMKRRHISLGIILIPDMRRMRSVQIHGIIFRAHADKRRIGPVRQGVQQADIFFISLPELLQPFGQSLRLAGQHLFIGRIKAFQVRLQLIPVSQQSAPHSSLRRDRKRLAGKVHELALLIHRNGGMDQKHFRMPLPSRIKRTHHLINLFERGRRFQDVVQPAGLKHFPQVLNAHGAGHLQLQIGYDFLFFLRQAEIFAQHRTLFRC